MNNIAIILCAGNGTRMKSDKSKLLLEICGKTVVERTVETFSDIDEVNKIIIVCRESDYKDFQSVLSAYDVSYCFGGATRQGSVMNALATIDDCDLLLIHDGARPLITKSEIHSAIAAAKEKGAAAVGVPVKDTIKIVDKDLKIVDTPDRSKLISIRTPQIFDFDLYCECAKLAQRQGNDFTDDCKLIENCGKDVFVVVGDYGNIKITTPEDIAVAENIIKSRGEAL